MPTVTMTKGLPASGKTTWARERVDSTGNTVRINKDDLRAMCFNSKWTSKREKIILSLRDSILWSSMTEGFNVIIDDTNLNPAHEEKIKQVIEDFNLYSNTGHTYTFEVKSSFLDVSPQECVRRDAQRSAPVGEGVIWDQYRRWVKGTSLDRHSPPDPPAWDSKKKDCIIVDIDGTVAIHTDRSPYDGSRVMEDLPNLPVIDLVREYAINRGVEVIFVSGRDSGEPDENGIEYVRKLTQQWLVKYVLPEGNFLLLMRRNGDNRKDSIIKEELYHQFIEPHYNVMFVLDDRNQTVEAWRGLGLPCFQVAPGDF